MRRRGTGAGADGAQAETRETADEVAAGPEAPGRLPLAEVVAAERRARARMLARVAETGAADRGRRAEARRRQGQERRSVEVAGAAEERRLPQALPRQRASSACSSSPLVTAV